jgi:hypothetical protein
MTKLLRAKSFLTIKFSQLKTTTHGARLYF